MLLSWSRVRQTASLQFQAARRRWQRLRRPRRFGAVTWISGRRHPHGSIVARNQESGWDRSLDEYA